MPQFTSAGMYSGASGWTANLSFWTETLNRERRRNNQGRQAAKLKCREKLGLHIQSPRRPGQPVIEIPSSPPVPKPKTLPPLSSYSRLQLREPRKQGRRHFSARDTPVPSPPSTPPSARLSWRTARTAGQKNTWQRGTWPFTREAERALDTDLNATRDALAEAPLWRRQGRISYNLSMGLGLNLGPDDLKRLEEMKQRETMADTARLEQVSMNETMRRDQERQETGGAESVRSNFQHPDRAW